MKVHLIRDWNGPGDVYYRAKNSPFEMDEALLPHLPSTAIIEENGKKIGQPATRKRVLLARREAELDRPSDEGRPAQIADFKSDAELLANLDAPEPEPVKASAPAKK